MKLYQKVSLKTNDHTTYMYSTCAIIEKKMTHTDCIHVHVHCMYFILRIVIKSLFYFSLPLSLPLPPSLPTPSLPPYSLPPSLLPPSLPPSLSPPPLPPPVSSKADILIANELRDILREASLNRPPIRTIRRSESPSAHSLSSRGSRGSPAASSNKPTPTATPTSRTTELKGGMQ